MAKVKMIIAPSPVKQTLKRKVGYGSDDYEDEGISETRQKLGHLNVDGE